MLGPGRRSTGFAIAIALLCAVAVCGCGSTQKTVTRVLGYCGVSGCATVTGQVERCGGPAPGKCTPIPFISVSLLSRKGQLRVAEHAGTGHRLRRFRLLIPGSGRFVLQTVMNGERIRRDVTLRVHRVLHVNLVDSIY